VLVLYRVGETKGNGKGSVLMCAGLVQGGEDEGKWKGFSGDVCWFGTEWRRRREMERVQKGSFMCDRKIVNSDG
jgi:hypothetical protein